MMHSVFKNDDFQSIYAFIQDHLREGSAAEKQAAAFAITLDAIALMPVTTDNNDSTGYLFVLPESTQRSEKVFEVVYDWPTLGHPPCFEAKWPGFFMEKAKDA